MKNEHIFFYDAGTERNRGWYFYDEMASAKGPFISEREAERAREEYYIKLMDPTYDGEVY